MSDTSQHPSASTLDIAQLVKDANDAYLKAYRVGYSAGWEAACREAMKLVAKPIGEDRPPSVTCPICGGKGALTETGVHYCGCDA